MAITKQGQSELVKQAAPGVQSRVWQSLWRNLGRVGKASRGATHGAYRVARPVVSGVTKGITATGRAAARNPGKALTLGVIGGVGAANFKDNFKKNWIHTDPNQDLTYKASLAEGQGFPIPRPGSIKFKDPRLAEYYKSKKSDHILY